MPDCCAFCGEQDTRVLKERHHLLGVANSPETLLICLNCHRKITETQNSVAPYVRSRNASEEDRRAYVDVTIGAALELFGKYLKERGLKHGNRNKSL